MHGLSVAPVIRLDTVSWWTTAGDNTHSHTDVGSWTNPDTQTHPTLSISSDWQFGGGLWKNTPAHAQTHVSVLQIGEDIS